MTAAVILPANMTTYAELCRIDAVLPVGTYLVCYRMTVVNDMVDYQIQRVVDGAYLSVMSGQNGIDIIRLNIASALSIVARNRGTSQVTFSVSGNNRLSVIRLR